MDKSVFMQNIIENQLRRAIRKESKSSKWLSLFLNTIWYLTVNIVSLKSYLNSQSKYSFQFACFSNKFTDHTASDLCSLLPSTLIL